MGTPLRYFTKDPNNLGRGGGVYYHRGHGIFSKYSAQHDYNYRARGYNVDHIGLPKKSSFLHTGDGNLPKYYYVKAIKKKVR